MTTTKHFLITNYENYRGGINNLQVSRICAGAAGWSHIKQFTSQKGKAKTRAKAYAKKNSIDLIAY